MRCRFALCHLILLIVFAQNSSLPRLPSSFRYPISWHESSMNKRISSDLLPSPCHACGAGYIGYDPPGLSSPTEQYRNTPAMNAHDSERPDLAYPAAAARRRMLALAALAYFVLYIHRSLLNYLQPPLQHELRLTGAQLGFLRWGFILPYCLTQLGAGYLADRY